jgi:hypothetical protein
MKYQYVLRESCSLKESAYNSSSGVLQLKVIQPGFNKSKQRFYPASTLKRDYKIFEGAKMFADHQTDQEAKIRPEGSVNNWVANLRKVWVESDGTIKGEAVVIDPAFKEKLSALNKSGLITEMGISIRAAGVASQQEVDGVSTDYVESLVACRSVDFVTYAGAGGQVEAMESDPTLFRQKQNGDHGLVEAYMAMGLTEKEALVAAGQEPLSAEDRITALYLQSI